MREIRTIMMMTMKNALLIEEVVVVDFFCGWFWQKPIWIKIEANRGGLEFTTA